MAPYSDSLNEEQLKAVLHTQGPLIVFAGAGSGKTRVLTYRILNLIKTGLVRPEQILAVTFTNKAAREMKNRVSSLLQDDSAPLWVSTFHSTCVRILRTHARELGFSSEFAIYNRSDSLATIKRIMKSLDINPKQLAPKTILQEIDRAKNKYIDPDSYRSLHSLEYNIDERISEIYKAYQEELLSSNAMDFGDLLCNTVSLFKIAPEVLSRYHEQFRYILVDEYQDTNRVQYLLLELLVGKSRNICVVGDDDQSIYAFRGASIDNILSFQKDFPDALSVTLNQNYRSTKTILAAANAVISKNSKRQEKNLYTNNPKGSPIICYCAEDERDEARFVSEQIKEAAARGVSFSDIAVFYRTNAQSRSFEESFSDAAIPFRLYGGVRFYERKEIRDLISYLRILANPNDNESLLRIINTPTRGIGPSAVKKLAQVSRTEGVSIFEAIKLATDSNALGGAAQKKVLAFLYLIQDLQQEYLNTQQELSQDSCRSDCLSELLHLIAERSGYIEYLQRENSEEALGRIENINELYAVSQEFVVASKNENESPNIQNFIDRTSLVSDLDAENTTELDSEMKLGAVSMMTLHLAKGLEFSHAFLVGLEDGLLPHIRSLDSRASLEEERRLCYVGITRGQQQLYLSRCATRASHKQGGWSSGLASRFISDIPEEHIEDKGSFFETSWECNNQDYSW